MPSGLVAFVNKIECMGENVQFARAGDNVDISLK